MSLLRGDYRKISIEGKEYVRELYHYVDPDAEEFGTPGEIVLGHVIEEYNFKEDSRGSWGEQEVEINNEYFSIQYNFSFEDYDEEAKAYIETMDKVVESLEVNERVSATYYDYAWYEDEYIKFKYPQGWDVEVKNENDPLAVSGVYTETKGVQQIIISNEYNELKLSTPLDSTNFGHGLETWKYESDSETINFRHDVVIDQRDIFDYEIKTVPKLYEITEYGLGIFYAKVEIDQQVTPVLLIGEYSKDKETLTSYSPYYIRSDGFDFMATSQDTAEPVDVSIELESDIEVPVAFERCTEFVNEFFSSVEKSKSRLEAQGDWNIYKDDNLGIEMKIPNSWTYVENSSIDEKKKVKKSIGVDFVKKDKEMLRLRSYIGGHGFCEKFQIPVPPEDLAEAKKYNITEQNILVNGDNYKLLVCNYIQVPVDIRLSIEDESMNRYSGLEINASMEKSEVSLETYKEIIKSIKY